MRCARGYDVAGLKMKEYLSADVVRGKKETQCCKDVYYWYLNQDKPDIVRAEMSRFNIDILGLMGHARHRRTRLSIIFRKNRGN